VWLQISLRPYLYPILNKMETVSLAATSITLYLAAFYTVKDPLGEALLQIVTLVLIVGNVIVMIWFGSAITGAGAKSLLKQIGAMDSSEQQVRCRSVFDSNRSIRSRI
jgi:hypothetical protein